LRKRSGRALTRMAFKRGDHKGVGMAGRLHCKRLKESSLLRGTFLKRRVRNWLYWLEGRKSGVEHGTVAGRLGHFCGDLGLGSKIKEGRT